MALPIEGNQFPGDRPPDYRVGDFNVWDPEHNLPRKEASSIMASHTALAEAFDDWIVGDKYPAARCVGDVIAMKSGTYVAPPKQEPFKFSLPKGVVWWVPEVSTSEERTT